MQPELMNKYGVCQIWSIYAQRTMTSRISMYVGPSSLTANETQTEMVLEGLYQSKLHDSVQRQTVFTGFV